MLRSSSTKFYHVKRLCFKVTPARFDPAHLPSFVLVVVTHWIASVTPPVRWLFGLKDYHAPPHLRPAPCHQLHLVLGDLPHTFDRQRWPLPKTVVPCLQPRATAAPFARTGPSFSPPPACEVILEASPPGSGFLIVFWCCWPSSIGC